MGQCSGLWVGPVTQSLFSILFLILVRDGTSSGHPNTAQLHTSSSPPKCRWSLLHYSSQLTPWWSSDRCLSHIPLPRSVIKWVFRWHKIAQESVSAVRNLQNKTNDATQIIPSCQSPLVVGTFGHLPFYWTGQVRCSGGGGNYGLASNSTLLIVIPIGSCCWRLWLPKVPIPLWFLSYRVTIVFMTFLFIDDSSSPLDLHDLLHLFSVLLALFPPNRVSNLTRRLVFMTSI